MCVYVCICWCVHARAWVKNFKGFCVNVTLLFYYYHIQIAISILVTLSDPGEVSLLWCFKEDNRSQPWEGHLNIVLAQMVLEKTYG